MTGNLLAEYILSQKKEKNILPDGNGTHCRRHKLYKPS